MLQNGHYVNVMIWDNVILYHQTVFISNNVMIWECYEMGFFLLDVTKWVKIPF